MGIKLDSSMVKEHCPLCGSKLLDTEREITVFECGSAIHLYWDNEFEISEPCFKNAVRLMHTDFRYWKSVKDEI